MITAGAVAVSLPVLQACSIGGPQRVLPRLDGEACKTPRLDVHLIAPSLTPNAQAHTAETCPPNVAQRYYIQINLLRGIAKIENICRDEGTHG